MADPKQLGPPEEVLPDPTPFPLFFLPNFLGILFAVLLELFEMETKITSLLPATTHPMALFGLGVFALANTSSFLGGSVIIARLEYGVKFPNLYASKQDNKHAIEFNCVQRGHQNFIENLPQYILSVVFTALVADRPSIAGMMMLLISIGRCMYAVCYRRDISSRIAPLLLAQFSSAIGTGYGVLVAASMIGSCPFVQ